MKKLLSLIVLLTAVAASAEPVYLPNLKQNATGTSSGGKYYLDVAASLAEGATAADGGSLPAVTKVVSGYDGTNVQVLSTDTSGRLNVNNIAGTVSLPTGAATSAKQDTGNTSLSSIDGKLGSLGQKAMTGSAPVVIASDQSAIPASQSGTWNITNISGTVSLPTGAATAAKQPALGTAGTASSDVITVQGIASMTPLKTESAGTAGSGSSAGATVSTVITLSAPSNALGFVLQANDANTANLRWAVGRTATTTLGQQLQPGRDTGFVPANADVSLVAESGTQTYDIQWISR